MRPGTIVKEITIHAPAAHVWQWVGTEAGLRQWWQLDVTLEAKAGGRCRERGLFNGAPYQLEGIVTTYDPPHQLALLLTGEQPGAAWPTNMTITITLEENAGATRVRVEHQLAGGVPTAMARPSEPMFPQPRWPQPRPILNQLPGHPGPVVERSPAVHSDASQPPVDTVMHQVYMAWWATRLVSLLALTSIQEKKYL